MSNYYLCDTCGMLGHEVHIDGMGTGDYECAAYGFIEGKLPTNDKQDPRDVCERWKPKEAGE